jgi:ABC-type branched-subunit amino acid transport system ATPase component
VEQSIDFCIDVADDAVVLNLGRVRFTGSCSDAQVRSEAEAAYLGVA